MAVKKNNKHSVDSSKKFVVRRDGHRVSEMEYDTPEQAADEYGFWKRVIQNGRDYTSKVEVVEK